MEIVKREYKTYNFDELSQDAKEKAVEHFKDINVDYDDWNEFVIENFKEERLILCPKRWTDYSLKKDHANIKKQIKEWELKLDQLYKDLQVVYDEDFLGDIKVIQDKIEAISHEMMAINI